MTPFQKTLIISPHSDDEIIGCGGLLAKMARLGLGGAVIAYASIDRVRWDEAGAGLAKVGGGTLRQLGEFRAPTTWLDAEPLGQLVAAIEDVLDEVEPTCVLIPDPGGFHQEHRFVAEAAMAAMRPSGGTSHWRPPMVTLFEEPTDGWRITEPSRQTLFVELTAEDVAAKVAALAEHRSQARNWPSERSGQALESLAGLRGAQAGVCYAEAYTVLRWMV